jgi:CpeT protein
MEKSPKLLVLFCFVVNFSYAQFSPDLKKLATMMQGSFSSELQSKNDSTYFDIRLHIVPIWQNRTDGIWMYVEQAVAKMQDKPYRQRVYKLTETGTGSFESAVFILKSPLRFAGKPELVEKLSPDSLTLKDGCSVILKKDSKRKFTGGTEGSKCPSDLKNASYASSEVFITPKMMVSWDRGFDKNGSQVWGAQKGGYRFIKKRKK